MGVRINNPATARYLQKPRGRVGSRATWRWTRPPD